MRLCIVSLKKFYFDGSNYWTYGGFGDYVNSLVPFFDEVSLCVRVTDKPLQGMYLMDDPKLSFTHLPCYTNELSLILNWPKVFWKMRRAIKEADVVNPRIPDMTGVAGWLWTKWYGKPHFVSIQSDMKAFLEAPNNTKTKGIVRQGLYAWLRFYLFWEAVIAKRSLCFPQGRRLYDRYPKRSSWVEWMSSSLSDADLAAHGRDPTLSDEVALLHVGRVTRPKGHTFLVELLSHLNQEFPAKKFFLTCVGKSEGPVKAEAQKRADELGVASQITWLDGVPRSEALSFMDKADIFVFPSLWEGTPKAVLEALARGLPVVASDVGGIPSLIRNEETGILVRPHDSRALTEGVARMITNKKLREKCARNGLEFARSKTVAAQAKVMIDHLARHYRDDKRLESARHAWGYV